MLKLVVPTFYQQYNEPKNPNEYSVWNNLSDNKIYVFVEKWREMCRYQIENKKENEESYEISKEDYEFLKSFKKWIGSD